MIIFFNCNLILMFIWLLGLTFVNDQVKAAETNYLIKISFVGLSYLNIFCKEAKREARQKNGEFAQ